MKEQLYTIPVNDIFDKPCECPVCAMKLKLENDAVSFAMGPSYMEDDIRLTTDKIGFCARHMQMMYDFENRLGLALIMDTHMKNMIKEIELLTVGAVQSKLPMYNIQSMKILVPPTEVIEDFQHKFDIFNEQIEANTIEIQRLYELQSVLLAKLAY